MSILRLRLVAATKRSPDRPRISVQSNPYGYWEPNQTGLDGSGVRLESRRTAISQIHHSERGSRLQPWRRLPGRELHPARNLLEEAGGGIGSDEVGGHRRDGRGPAAVHGDCQL